MSKLTTSEPLLGIIIIVLLLLNGLLMFIPAFFIAAIWNYLATPMGAPELTIWMAWVIVLVFKMIAPSSK